MEGEGKRNGGNGGEKLKGGGREGGVTVNCE